MSKGSNDKRIRAFFFVKVGPSSNADEIAEKIYDKLGYKKNEKEEGEYVDYVIIRADVVSGCTLFDIIVPVDIDPDETSLETIKSLIIDTIKPEVITISRAQVTKHNPDPPHATFGYLTEAEFTRGREPDIGVSVDDPKVPKLQSPYSPGANKWG